MYEGLLHLHSFLRWVILILLVVVLYQAVTRMKQPFSPAQRKTGLSLMIIADIMLLVGLYQWAFGKTWGLIALRTRGFGDVMKNDPVGRFFAVEHLAGMLIAIIMIHIGYAYAKKNIPDQVKQRRTILYYALAMLIILISIPWPFRAVGAGRHWFPGMG